jgi:hypothetical protein
LQVAGIGHALSNVAADARAFGERHGGAVYAPFTGLRRYAIAGDAPWPDLTQLQQYVPVCVTEPYGPSWTACVAGGDVVWADPEPPPGVRALQPGLRRFAAAASLDFVALAIAAARDGLATVAVERDPLLEQFNEPSRQAIVSGLVRLLTGKLRPERARRLGPPRLDAGRESGLGPARPQRGGDRL